jgi:hypothetical protein
MKEIKERRKRPRSCILQHTNQPLAEMRKRHKAFNDSKKPTPIFIGSAFHFKIFFSCSLCLLSSFSEALAKDDAHFVVSSFFTRRPHNLASDKSIFSAFSAYLVHFVSSFFYFTTNTALSDSPFSWTTREVYSPAGS